MKDLTNMGQAHSLFCDLTQRHLCYSQNRAFLCKFSKLLLCHSSRTKFKSTRTGRCFPHSITLGQMRIFAQGRNVTSYKECSFWQLANNKKIYNYCTPIYRFPLGRAFIASFLKTNFDLNLSCKSVVWEKIIATLVLTHSGISACLGVTMTNNRKMHAKLEMLLQCSPWLHFPQILWQVITHCALLFLLCALSLKIFGSNWCCVQEIMQSIWHRPTQHPCL